MSSGGKDLETAILGWSHRCGVTCFLLPEGFAAGCDVCQEVGASPISAGDQEFLCSVHPLQCTEALKPCPGPSLSRGIPGMFQLPPILRGRQPGAAAASLLLIPHGAKSGTSPLRSVVLPSHKATVGRQIIPDQMSLSAAAAAPARSAFHCLHLPSCSCLHLTFFIWESQPAFIDCLPYFFRSSVLLFLSTGLAP